jgi:CheY-like chemotaxis protein
MIAGGSLPLCSAFRGYPLEEECLPTTSLKGTILVADDNENIREPLVEMLRLNCYRVIAVSDGEQAFTEACSQPVDLVLLDVMMPGPTGFSVCRAIKARPETRFVPVVLITGLANAEDRIRASKRARTIFCTSR